MFLHTQDGLNLLNKPECFYTPPRSSCTLVAHATEKLVHRLAAHATEKLVHTDWRHTPTRSSCTDWAEVGLQHGGSRSVLAVLPVRPGI